MTQLQQVANAILAALNAGPPMGVPATVLWKGKSVEPALLPYQTLAWLDELTDRVGGKSGVLSRRRVRFAIQTLMAGSPVATPQELCEVVRSWSVKQLAGNLFNGLVLDIEEIKTGWKLEQADTPYVRMTHEFEASFTTQVKNLELKA